MKILSVIYNTAVKVAQGLQAVPGIVAGIFDPVSLGGNIAGELISDAIEHVGGKVIEKIKQTNEYRNLGKIYRERIGAFATDEKLYKQIIAELSGGEENGDAKKSGKQLNELFNEFVFITDIYGHLLENSQTFKNYSESNKEGSYLFAQIINETYGEYIRYLFDRMNDDAQNGVRVLAYLINARFGELNNILRDSSVNVKGNKLSVEYQVLVCPNCGSTELMYDKDSGTYTCKACGKKHAAKIETYNANVEILTAIESVKKAVTEGFNNLPNEFITKKESYNNYWINLDRCINAEFLNSKDIINWCDKILEIEPDDRLAQFYRMANSEGNNERKLCNYLKDMPQEFFNKANYEFIRRVVEFLIRIGEGKVLVALKVFLESCRGIFLPAEKDGYLSTVEDFINKINERFFDPAKPRAAFIMYDTDEMDKVVFLVEKLEENENIECYYAARNLRNGKNAIVNYELDIKSAIRHCRCVILVSTKKSRDNPNVNWERNYILDNCADMIRFEYLIEDYQPNEPYKAEWERFFASAHKYTIASINELRTQILSILNTKTKPANKNNSKDKPKIVADTNKNVKRKLMLKKKLLRSFWLSNFFIFLTIIALFLFVIIGARLQISDVMATCIGFITIGGVSLLFWVVSTIVFSKVNNRMEDRSDISLTTVKVKKILLHIGTALIVSAFLFYPVLYPIVYVSRLSPGDLLYEIWFGGSIEYYYNRFIIPSSLVVAGGIAWLISGAISQCGQGVEKLRIFIRYIVYIILSLVCIIFYVIMMEGIFYGILPIVYGYY